MNDSTRLWRIGFQAGHSIRAGLWYARSAEIIHSPVMETLVWLRAPGDVIFAAGGVFPALFAWRRGGAREHMPEPLGMPAYELGTSE